jgi:NIPSNAP
MLGMDRRALLQAMGAAAVMPLVGGSELKAEAADNGVDKDTVYELRIYHAPEGKLEPLLARFRGPERPIFERHGMHCVAFWTSTDEPLKGRTLTYMLRHKSRAIADKNWQAFRDDPEWVKLKATTEANGPLVEKHESYFLSLTDFSPVL